MKTIKQIADELGVSKTAVRNQIANLGLQSSLRKNGNQFAIDEKQESLILQAFMHKTKTKSANQSQTKSQTVCTSNIDNENQLYDILQAELAAKNQLIEKQQETIGKLTATIEEQAQSINADRQKELAGKLIEGQQLISDNAPKESPQNKNLFFRIFGKKK